MTEDIAVQIRNALLKNKDPEQTGSKIAKLRAVERRLARKDLYETDVDPSWVRKCERFNNRCAYCGTPSSPSKLTRDHLVARVRGGPNFVVPCCARCNGSKGDLYIRDWIKRLVREEVHKTQYLCLLGDVEITRVHVVRDDEKQQRRLRWWRRKWPGM